MSAAQIIEELPRLAPSDLRAVRERLIQLAEEDEDVALCDLMADAGARMLDEMEAAGYGEQASRLFAQARCLRPMPTTWSAGRKA